MVLAIDTLLDALLGTGVTITWFWDRLKAWGAVGVAMGVLGIWLWRMAATHVERLDAYRRHMV